MDAPRRSAGPTVRLLRLPPAIEWVSNDPVPFKRECAMLWTIAVILLILWALGFLAFEIGSGLIHLLLVIALIVVVYRLVTGRRPVA